MQVESLAPLALARLSSDQALSGQSHAVLLWVEDTFPLHTSFAKTSVPTPTPLPSTAPATTW